jgi:uncharacterized protein
MKNNRILIIDSLRGVALLLIVIIHFVEHFDFFSQPQVNFIFTENIDDIVMGATFFFISGKAYSIFALLFGFSFYIQISRKEAMGIDFRGRFLWRLIILLFIGILHSLVFRGDILHIYAVYGLFLVPLYRLNDRALLILSAVLALQIPMFFHLIRSFFNPEFSYSMNLDPSLWQKSNEIYAHGSFIDVLSFNLIQGRKIVWAWTFHTGRYLQLISLFILGLVLGREKIFENLTAYKKQLNRLLILSISLMIMFKVFMLSAANADFSDTQQKLLRTILASYFNLAFTSVLVCLILLLYLRFSTSKIFHAFGAYGKMSLTNYVSQGIFGVLIFYGFGLGLYKYMGATLSVFASFLFFFLQSIISIKWNQNFYFGPLEWIWRSLTYLTFNVPFRKKK